MQADYCNQEAAVLEAVEAGRWPQACDAELREHVAQCAICSDVVLVAQLLQKEGQGARSEAVLPAAGLVWWKAQMRAKREAAARAAEPIALVQKAACAFAILSMVTLAVWRWDLVASWFEWMAGIPQAPAFSPDNSWATTFFSNLHGFGLIFLISASACALLTSLVLYLAFREE